MPVTPISATGKIRLNFEVSGLPHVIDSYVAVDTTTTPYTVMRNIPMSGSDVGNVPAQAIWDLIKVFYPAGVLAPSWELLERDVNIYIPRDGGALTGNGTGSGSVFIATQFTLTFRDVEQHEVRLQIPETLVGAPSHAPASGAVGGLAALIAGYLHVPDGTNVGTWVQSRAGKKLDRALFASTDTNDKYRRARGV